MTRRRDDIVRPDARIGARVETLAYLFDVSVQTVLNAVNAGRIRPSQEVFGVKLYHVKTVEKAVFGLGDSGEGEIAGADEDPALKGIRDAQARKQRHAAA